MKKNRKKGRRQEGRKQERSIEIKKEEK